MSAVHENNVLPIFAQVPKTDSFVSRCASLTSYPGHGILGQPANVYLPCRTVKNTW